MLYELYEQELYEQELCERELYEQELCEQGLCERELYEQKKIWINKKILLFNFLCMNDGRYFLCCNKLICN